MHDIKHITLIDVYDNESNNVDINMNFIKVQFREPFLGMIRILLNKLMRIFL